MLSFNVDTVFHAAAYKHVPLVGQNVVEGVQNNIMGTRTVIAAIMANVDNFTLISTDKAVRPTNFMGATKRIAELYARHTQRTSQRPAFQLCALEMYSGHRAPSFRVSKNRLSMVGQ